MRNSDPDYRTILTAAQMRWADQQTIERIGLPGAALMESAGHTVAERVCHLLPRVRRVLVLAGPGNNGGDGFVAARYLHEAGIAAEVALAGDLESLKGDALLHARTAVACGVTVHQRCQVDAALRNRVIHAGLVVDALFGTGLVRELSGQMHDLVCCVNEVDTPVLAVDIASGLCSDTGGVLGCAVQAMWTLPIAVWKWGHLLGEGRRYSGELLPPAAIGIPAAVLRQSMQEVAGAALAAWVLDDRLVRQGVFQRSTDSHKGKGGHVWVFGGSHGYTGAPRLSAAGAFAAGAGLVSIACPADVYEVLATAETEVMVHDQARAPWQKADALVAGPGWGREQQKQLQQLLAVEQPLVLDADALNMLADDGALAKGLMARKGLSVLTPHPGEAGRLLGMSAEEVQRDRLGAVLALAERFRAWVVLKGADTLIASPEKEVWLSPFAAPALATAGSGDVLSGMIAACLAGRREAQEAITAAVMLHALAGIRMSEESSMAWLAGEIPVVVRRVLAELS